jgi:putative endonuclease
VDSRLHGNDKQTKRVIPLKKGIHVAKIILDSHLHGNDKQTKRVIPLKKGIHEGVMNQYYVYIMASKKNGTLYIGVTNDLIRRVYEHRNNLVEGFTQKYAVHLLVFYEIHNDINNAIQREKRLKKWNRAWKIELIEKENPEWNDLYNGLI